jgi:hypothetical protein
LKNLSFRPLVVNGVGTGFVAAGLSGDRTADQISGIQYPTVT